MTTIRKGNRNVLKWQPEFSQLLNEEEDHMLQMKNFLEDEDEEFMDNISEGSKLLQDKQDAEDKTEKPKYPRSVFFIIGNEFCERFSYYGMRTILTLFLIEILTYSDDTATVIYHVFTMFNYFTPLFGAIIADSFLGKYRTILYISMIYCVGNIVLAAAAVPRFIPMIPFTMIGLLLIAFGTGGIKPCVSAFGGDQFKPGQERELQKFFSLFYLSINSGSLISTFLTPVLRADVKCFGEDSCYSLAFGVPAVLMIVALCLFFLGRSMYVKVPPTGNIVVKAVSCIFHALKNKSKEKKGGIKKEHWLDNADDKYDLKFINDLKPVLNVLLLYILLPVFWALFDQQGSRWTLQATRMDGQLGGFLIRPDQMQVINPLLIIAFIPLFEYVIYPIFAKCNLLVKPLQRMTIGGLLAASSFVVAGFLQLYIESSLPKHPDAVHSDLFIINSGPCNLNMNSSLHSAMLKPQEMTKIENLLMNHTYDIEFEPSNCQTTEPWTYKLLTNETVETLFVSSENSSLKFKDSLEKSEKGESDVRILMNLIDLTKNNYTFFLKGKDKNYELNIANVTDVTGHLGYTLYTRIVPNEYDLYLKLDENKTYIGSFITQNGGRYIITVSYDTENPNKITQDVQIVVPANTISILLQIPQYVIITAGEIMFSITGLEFSYSQAPKSMKSVLQAAWLLTVAFGNLIVVIIAEAKIFELQSYEFFMFACLMAVDMAIFAFMAYYYKYVSFQSEESPNDIAKDNKELDNGHDNLAFKATKSLDEEGTKDKKEMTKL